ncbi:unnamed protein product [Caenorhabditis sp. 36 PRJEB53466]|nr:unnamed protein product [Caenorhabditis sp. 36 PRJEB53466]
MEPRSCVPAAVDKGLKSHIKGSTRQKKPSEMSRLLLLALSFVALCLGQDSSLYVNRIPIHGRLDDSKTYTYFVDDNYDPVQTENYKTESNSIASLYEDDYSADTVSCTVAECPKLTRLYAYVAQSGGKVQYTQILTAAMKNSSISPKPMGYVAPYPGYCSSDDSLPIIELYSQTYNKYAYWSPAQPSQYIVLNSTDIDLTRYVPKRLVGYGLSATPARLVLENKSPDYAKTLSRANYTHSFCPANEIVEYKTGTDTYMVIGKPAHVDAVRARATATFSRSLGIFLPDTSTALSTNQVNALCGTRITIWAIVDPEKVRSRLVPANYLKNLPQGWSNGAIAGTTFRTNVAACGGISGLANLTEFVHTTNANRYTYAVDPVEVAALKADSNWNVTPESPSLGFAPIDKIGFTLFNDVFQAF